MTTPVIIFIILLALLLFGGIRQYLKLKNDHKVALVEMERKEALVWINYAGTTMSIRREELPRWNNMTPTQKNAMAMHHRELVRKGKIVQKEDGFVPIEAIRQDTTANK